MKDLRSALLLSQLFIITGVLSGCAFGQRISYTEPTLISAPKSTPPLLIVTADDRPYVRSGNKNPNWVGLMRSGFGIPYGVHTRSGKPFADDVQSLVTNSLKQQNVDIVGLSLPSGTKQTELESAQLSNPGRTLMLLSIRDWKTDVYFRAGLKYDLSLTIYDRSLKEVTSEQVSGDTTLNSSNPRLSSPTAALGGFIETLLSRPEIVTSLNSFANQSSPVITEKIAPSNSKKAKAAEHPSARAGMSNECTTAQILTMKSSGLSAEQIGAACDQ